MHFVLDVFVDLGQFAFEVQVDVEVKIPERSEKENLRIKARTLARKIKSFSHLRESHLVICERDKVICERDEVICERD